MNTRVILVLFAAFVGSFFHTAALAASEAEIAAILRESKTLRDQITPGFEWRYTGARMKEAEELLAAGKLEEAEAMALKVRREINLALEQVEAAKAVWAIAVPK